MHEDKILLIVYKIKITVQQRREYKNLAIKPKSCSPSKIEDNVAVFIPGVDKKRKCDVKGVDLRVTN